MEQLARLLHEHYVNFPNISAQDAVKFLYQHHMGPGHLISNETAVLTRLKEEWDTVPAAPDAPLSHPLGNGLCRLNLNKCKAIKLSPRTVARLFVLTAQQFIPNPQGLEACLDLVHSLPLPKEETDA